MSHGSHPVHMFESPEPVGISTWELIRKTSLSRPLLHLRAVLSPFQNHSVHDVGRLIISGSAYTPTCRRNRSPIFPKDLTRLPCRGVIFSDRCQVLRSLQSNGSRLKSVERPEQWGLRLRAEDPRSGLTLNSGHTTHVVAETPPFPQPCSPAGHSANHRPWSPSR